MMKKDFIRSAVEFAKRNGARLVRNFYRPAEIKARAAKEILNPSDFSTHVFVQTNDPSRVGMSRFDKRDETLTPTDRFIFFAQTKNLTTGDFDVEQFYENHYRETHAAACKRLGHAPFLMAYEYYGPGAEKVANMRLALHGVEDMYSPNFDDAAISLVSITNYPEWKLERDAVLEARMDDERLCFKGPAVFHVKQALATIATCTVCEFMNGQEAAERITRFCDNLETQPLLVIRVPQGKLPNFG